MPKIVVEGWTIHPLRRGRDKGVIDPTEPTCNYLRTRICSVCRRRSCAAVKGYEEGAKGLCRYAIPNCSNDTDTLCKELGAPSRPKWDSKQPRAGMKAYHARAVAVERFAHRVFRKCHKVKLTVER